MKLSLEIDRGPDRGQNYGSLFEARTSDGSAVVGAGFQGLFNTYHRADRHVVQLFVRPTSGYRTFAVESLPRPSQLAGTYLFDLDGTLYSSSDGVRSWDNSRQQWQDDSSSAPGRMRLGSGLLTFDGGNAEYGGRPLLPPPDRGEYQRFFYALGHLCFYHTFWAGQDGYRLHTVDDEGFSKLYACPWTPGDGPVDLSRANVLTLPCVGETPFSYGQLGTEVLTCSNIGGVYVFDGRGWRMVVAPEIGTSYQVYSMLNYRDRLLMGHYPSGELLEYAGGSVDPIGGWPPRLEGVAPNAREAQTTVIYGGDLFVGVWPWAELWRYSPDAGSWSFTRRMFTHPEVTDQTTHPYERESGAAGLVANQWGQRVTSLVPLGQSLYVSTSAKSPVEWQPEYTFVGDDRWLEYGVVYRLTTPGSLSAPVRWTGEPTRLEFICGENGMAIVQDGRRLAAGPPLDMTGTVGVSGEDVTWGRGVFGQYGGLTLDGQIETD